jgi:isopentenyl phosphate kinase
VLKQAQAPLFVKLGGSLITDKRRPECPRREVLQQLAAEIAAARRQNPHLPLVIGHGSGSFGHLYGQRYGTRAGVQSAEQWYGFARTGDAAARLNRLVTAALLDAGVPAWSIQPSATLRCVDGAIREGPLAAVRQALAHHLAPVIFGDVALDERRGGTIVSTEELFSWLTPHLLPQRLILVGEIDGVYTADPHLDSTATRLREITPPMFQQIQTGLGGSHGVDVTGGMVAKVQEAIRLVNTYPQLDVIICSGLTPGNLSRVLDMRTSGIGTRIYHP